MCNGRLFGTAGFVAYWLIMKKLISMLLIIVMMMTTIPVVTMEEVQDFIPGDITGDGAVCKLDAYLLVILIARYSHYDFALEMISNDARMSKAALITPESQINGQPSIFDLFEMVNLWLGEESIIPAGTPGSPLSADCECCERLCPVIDCWGYGITESKDEVWFEYTARKTICYSKCQEMHKIMLALLINVLEFGLKLN